MGMFGFGRKSREEREEEGLRMAEKIGEGKGFAGRMTKMIMGQEMTDQVREATQAARTGQAGMAAMAQAGVPTQQATVAQIVDTGQTINDNPVVDLVLDLEGQRIDMHTMVSRLQIPRPGDRAFVMQNPAGGGLPGLGSVLREREPVVEAALCAHGDRVVGGLRPHLSREALREGLAAAGRLLYVGHVTTGAYGLDTRLHLTDGPESSGRAELVAGVHRPLTAADIALGDRWRMPARVALIACASGGEQAFADPTGLVSAVTARGAAGAGPARPGPRQRIASASSSSVSRRAGVSSRGSAR